MPTRTLPQQTIAASTTPQPIFSTTFNGSITAQTIAANPGYLSVLVASSAGFRAGDYVALSPGTSNFEYGKVVTVPDSTHLGLQAVRGLIYDGAIGAHSSGEFISIVFQYINVFVQRVTGDANIMYIGGPGVTSTSNVIATITGVASGQPGTWQNTCPTGKTNAAGSLWVTGTISTVYDVSFTV